MTHLFEFVRSEANTSDVMNKCVSVQFFIRCMSNSWFKISFLREKTGRVLQILFPV